MSDCLCQQGLTATGGAVEEHSLRGTHTEFVELVRMLDRIQDHLLEILLHVLETTDIFPSHVGDFNYSFSQTGWVGLSHGESEVLVGDGHSIENLGINGLIFDVNQVHLLSDALKRSLCAESSHISTHITVSLLSNIGKIDVFSEFHVLGVNSENFHSAYLVGDSDVELAIEATESSESRVD